MGWLSTAWRKVRETRDALRERRRDFKAACLRRVPVLRRAVGWMRYHKKRVTTAFVLICHIAGAITSLQAIMETRTSQGAIAWAVSLNTFPYVAVPAYWLFGKSEFEGYITARQAAQEAGNEQIEQQLEAYRNSAFAVDAELNPGRVLENLVELPFTRGNHAELLINGEETFSAIFEDLRHADDYILVEFYILRDDRLGTQLQQILLDKAAEGVRVYVLYDEIGSMGLSDAYVRELREGGVQISGFNTTRGPTDEWRVNFRNHRKIVVVDGRVAFVGGHNVGDEYVEGTEELGPIRDTHVRVEGPVVQCVQLAFAEDWHWATKEVPPLEWAPALSDEGDLVAFCLPSGPADEFETAAMFFIHAINTAEKRVWIASPYFVPDEQMVTALQLAALRGVDVRILIPDRGDSTLVWLSSFSYLEEMDKAGIGVYRYQPGFLHEKVMLVDEKYASVGTANFDNRSFRLNFEITVVIADEDFAGRVAAMLEEDFEHSERASPEDLSEASYRFRVAVRVARLLAPIQ